MRIRTITIVALAGAIGIAGGVLAASTSGSDSTVEASGGNFDLAQAASFTDFALYYAGESFDGLPLTAVLRRADKTTVPDEPIKPNFVAFIYGDCAPEADSGCAPPIEIQVWPACLRNRAAIELPVEGELEIRGALADFYEGGERLEVATGRESVVIFGDESWQVLRAAAALQGVNVAVSPEDALPPPAAGAVEGRLTC